MTQEEKDLLLKDLCARLPYGVKCDYEGSVLSIDKLDVTNEEVCGNLIAWYDAWPVEKCKPYLRPMSSMTEEEKKEISELIDAPIEIDSDGDIIYLGGYSIIPCSDYQIYIDYLISHHFDFRGLIPMGLALEAHEDMYKID